MATEVHVPIEHRIIEWVKRAFWILWCIRIERKFMEESFKLWVVATPEMLRVDSMISSGSYHNRLPCSAGGAVSV
jgi:hypothetical protein